MIRRVLFSLLTIALFFSIGHAYAADGQGVSGGWDERTGYFKTVSDYNNSLTDKISIPAADEGEVKHTGKRESKVIDGTRNHRAHGWTTWVGVYHYTRARMEQYFLGTTYILTDSGRICGEDGTEAISPWWAYDPDIDDKARTYYGH